ncbi:general transcription factor 3C polypeptide 6-like [Hydra vulgaris]|uniref:general transcription factor 3C polypeptide 6-like n=1 Tax=Hydra vulgaris TaxID=6087 RepID=UPI0032EA77F1
MDDEWEEQYVFVELVGLVDPEKIEKCTKENTAILGINGNRPIINLCGYAFSGSYQDSLGTMVLFEENIDGAGNKALKYASHTTKILEASRVFLKPNVSSDSMENKNISQPND